MTGNSLPSIAIWVCHSGSQPQSDYYSQQGCYCVVLIQAWILIPTFSSYRRILSMVSLSRRGLNTFHKSTLESMLCLLLPSLLIDRGKTENLRLIDFIPQLINILQMREYENEDKHQTVSRWRSVHAIYFAYIPFWRTWTGIESLLKAWEELNLPGLLKGNLICFITSTESSRF